MTYILLKGLLAFGFLHLSQKRPYVYRMIKVIQILIPYKTHTDNKKIDYPLRIAFDVQDKWVCYRKWGSNDDNHLSIQ